ncbi:epoxyqueuosine reductase QueH [Helicobacter sp. 23-1045]
MLVHICCSVDSHYFLQRLREIYPHENLIGFFYNPNIHPSDEYDLRLQEVRRSCENLQISLICGEYEIDSWLESVAGFECADEKGERCSICFESRLNKTALLALNLGESKITTTLLTSPMKSQNELFALGDNVAQKYGLEFIKVDFRSNGGTQIQADLAKSANLYRQNYCGCVFALTKQRERKGAIALELFDEIGGRALKGSAKYHSEIFAKVWDLERKGRAFILQKNTINAWRLLNANVKKINGEVINSYIFAHSKAMKNQKIRNIKWHEISVDSKKIAVGFADNALFLSVESTNKIFGTNHKNALSLRYNPPKFDDELKLRAKLLGSDSIKPIIAVDLATAENLTININAIFQSTDIFEIIEL